MTTNNATSALYNNPLSGLASSSSSTAARAADTTPTSSSSSSDDSSTQITSSDFMTLLVTEMKNQDPTQPTDPNAYIQQLVEVNSLQQLVSINSELGSSSSAATQSALQKTAATSVI